MNGTEALLTESVEAPEMAEAREILPPAIAPAKRPGPARGANPGLQSLFRVIWRWHFYAGVIIAPVLVVMSVTGGLYIFKAEIEEFARRDLLFVTPGPSRVTYQAQVDAALAAHPGTMPAQIQVHNDPDRATIITLRPARRPGEAPPQGREGFRSQVNVYVNPYDGKILGQLGGASALNSFFQTILSIHRTLWAGTTGRVITELATSWSIVLVVTGVYLWWPRKKAKAAGVWTLRWKAKLYTLLRDLHSVGGIYLMPICATILVTGMFYTLAVGTVIHKAAHEWVGEDEPAAEAPRSKGERGPRPDAVAAQRPPAPPSLPLDTLIGTMRERFPDRILMASLGEGRGRRGAAAKSGPSNGMMISAGNDFNRTYGPMVGTSVTLDKSTGKVLAEKDNSQMEFFWHQWTYPLHVGSFWGLATKIPWLIACVVLTILPITGLWMWWERRPKGRSGLPRRPDVRVPAWLIGVIAVLGVFLPVMGASVVLILLGEAAYGLVRRDLSPAA
ncbi:PepSY-associated TM helix domain-containing protein [Tundrisphaera sp. TA3]|uniref:PepSY-associated TM helix domain-containing protein n=1 Tax=Tundrisphaera sp. TA3 TaxID=3435775 RepID=UPI003EBE9548